MLINEIAPIHSSNYTGGKDVLPTYNQVLFKKEVAKSRPLPGGSGIRYVVEKNDEKIAITLLDPNPQTYSSSMYGGIEAVGKLVLYRKKWPTPNAYDVSTITVNEDYRGRGMAKAMYGIALSIMKITLISGDSQTPGGQRNWASLSQIPGVAVSGYGTLEDNMFDHETRQGVDQNKLEMVIDAIMELGADFIGKYTAWGEPYHVFKFPVTVNPNKVLQNAIDDTKFSMYGNLRYPYAFGEIGLMATWHGT